MATTWSISNLFPLASSFSITHRKRWKLRLFLRLVLCLKLFSLIKSHSVSNGPNKSSCNHVLCYHGTCHDGKCHCERGWQGSACHMCEGRTLLNTSSGQITDGKDNYSTDLQCTWLIDSGKPNSTIRLKFTEFATECGWDHLYIFDGDSIYSPLIGAFSGVLVKDGFNRHEPPEILATSGKAYLYFYSDAAFNMSGFIIDYNTNACPQNCSSHGLCIDGVCTCSGGWTGSACDRPVCPNKCSSNGHCDIEGKRCICDPGYIGDDCSQSESMENWMTVHSIGTIKGRALHQSVILNNSMWVIGGESFEKAPKEDEFAVRFDLKLKKWEPIETSGPTRPEPQSGHSLVVYNDSLYVFGGKLLKNGLVVNDLWRYNGIAWELVKSNESIYSRLCDYCAPLKVMGHTATVVNDKMIVIFGHSSIYGYLNTVQEYDFERNSWTIVETTGAVVRGGFGHTSVYYPEKDLIYVHAGYHSSQTDSLLVDSLYSYSPSKNSWKLLSPSTSPRYLHSSVIISGVMYVFGGNGHNSTHDNAGNKCFSVQFLAYDIECDSWSTMNQPSIKNVGRYGHSAVVHKDEMYIFGGFNGVMLNSFLKFYPGDCPSPSSSSGSLSSSLPSSKQVSASSSFFIGSRSGHRKNCLKSKPTSIINYSKNTSFCEMRQTNFSDLCSKLSDCDSCLENSYGCIWCGDSCSYEKCRKSGSKGNTDLSKCDGFRRKDAECDKIDNCQYCHTKPHCRWQNTQPPKCLVNRDQPGVSKSGNFMNNNFITMSQSMSREDNRMCDTPCYTRTSCSNCSHGSCMWCSSNQHCIDSNAYAAIFSLGQCMEWTIHLSKCSCSISQTNNKCIALNCTDIATCDACQKNPRCGWCDDGLGTGVGRCLEGSHSVPRNAKECPPERWYFVSCPDCQCNGHSECKKDNKVCDQPCKHLTEGSNCQRCKAGHYGNPVNGGKCHVCKCNNHSTECNPDNGKCFCTTKGITGHNCEKCDEAGHYHGDPTKPGGSCFYNLSVDFQYTFNMSKPDDKYFSRINFMNAPSKPDVDVDFTISCSGKALVNISIGSPLENKSLQSQLDCGSFKLRFSHEDNSFGSDNTTFFVNVYDFKTPFVLQISFSQHRTLDLLQFFVTFSTCFLTLLIIAAVLWKIKQRYDIYRRRQQAFLELEHMASRPFASIFVELRSDYDISTKSRMDTGDGNYSIVRRRDPTPIALEPCATGKAAVLSLILRLPSGGQRTVPSGQTGLAIGSALVSLGTVDQKFAKGNEGHSVKLNTTKGANSSTGV